MQKGIKFFREVDRVLIIIKRAPYYKEYYANNISVLRDTVDKTIVGYIVTDATRTLTESTAFPFGSYILSEALTQIINDWN